MARKLLDTYNTPWEVYAADPYDGKWPASNNLFISMMRELGKGVVNVS